MGRAWRTIPRPLVDTRHAGDDQGDGEHNHDDDDEGHGVKSSYIDAILRNYHLLRD